MKTPELIVRLQAENDALRSIICRSVASIGNGSMMAETCSLEFMGLLPSEIRLAIEKHLAEIESQRDVAVELAKANERLRAALERTRVSAANGHPCLWCGAESRLFRFVRGTPLQACNEHRTMMPELE